MAAACLALAAAFPAWPQDGAAVPAEREDEASVLELMRLETAQALEQARARAQSPAQQAASPGQPVLLAIYGVGNRLTAELALGTRRYRYRAGQALPLGQPTPGSAPPRMLALDKSCIRLELGGHAQRLCLAASTWPAP